jgi:hypothetical protein
MLRNHKTEIESIMCQSKKVQNAFFDEKRREGIYAYNIRVMAESKGETDGCLRERQPKEEDSLKMCTVCKRFLSNRAFYKHRHTCNQDGAVAVAVDVANTSRNSELGSIKKDEEFVENILNKFRDNDAGNLCRNDNTLQQIGHRHFKLRWANVSKRDGIRKNVMGEMRELARLFLCFQSLATNPELRFKHMFTREHLPVLLEAVDKMVEKEDQTKEKSGLKLNLDALIKRAIKSLKGIYSTSSSYDAEYAENEKFQQAYSFRVPEVYANARYDVQSNSLLKARRPEALPHRSDLQKLNAHIAAEVRRLTAGEFDVGDYCTLRSLIVCRLTLFKARRGDEPSRMLLREWEDALDGVWLPPDKHIERVHDEAEKYLLNQYRLAYLHGKGAKFVPVLIPKDLIAPISSSPTVANIKSLTATHFSSPQSCHQNTVPGGMQ